MQNTQQNFGNLNQDIFRDIERTGEELKEELKGFVIDAQKIIDMQVNCSKFEAVYALTVSKKEREKTIKEVKEIRQGLWKESLKKAKGNPKNAYALYKEICAFD